MTCFESKNTSFTFIPILIAFLRKKRSNPFYLFRLIGSISYFLISVLQNLILLSLSVSKIRFFMIFFFIFSPRMSRRPTPYDDDEDLLREQEAFLRKNKPSAKCIRMKKESPNVTVTDNDKIEIDEVQQVLFEIQEKMSIVESEKPAGHPDGFPKVFSLGNTEQIGGKKKGKSLFKQKMEERKKKQGGVSESRPPPRPIPVRSLVEDEKIGHENAERLAKVNFFIIVILCDKFQLSIAEIEEEREQLLTRLDPSMLEFIRKRRYQGSSSEKEGPKVKLLEQSCFKTERGADVRVPLENVDRKWLNFGHVEPEKLEWMQDIEIKEIKGDVKVRVDFNGDVVNPIRYYFR